MKHDLVERYVHEVGRFLPENERKEITQELKSLLYDKIEDRTEGTPSDAMVSDILEEMGAPRTVAASYGAEQYLIGPTLYPNYMRVLRTGLTIIPSVFIGISLLTILTDSGTDLIALGINTLEGVIQVLFIFAGVVTLIFSGLQQAGVTFEENDDAWTAADLPEINHPGNMERFGTAIDLGFNVFAFVIMMYFLQVGGLTIRFNLSDPGTVIPVDAVLLMVFLCVIAAKIAAEVIAVQRGRWSIGNWAIYSLLDVAGAGLFFTVIVRPLVDVANGGFLSEIGLTVAMGPFNAFLAFIIAVAVISNGSKLVKMILFENGNKPDMTATVRNGV